MTVATRASDAGWTALPAAASLLGESPFWHPDEQVLYWCDIPGRTLNRWAPDSGRHDHWRFESELACCAPRVGGGLLLAFRDGLYSFDPHAAEPRRERLAEPPYDPDLQRFNDGKADPQGRLWVSTLYDPRSSPAAALYRYAQGEIRRMAGDITVGNGLAFSPDGGTLYWSDTSAHRVFAFDFDGSTGSITRQRVFASFAPRQPGQDLAHYGGRPDGAAMDAEGCYWVAMYEGQRLLRIAPDGQVLQVLPLPVRCPTMPCFGGPDLRTLFVTTAREKRPADELAAQPLAGHVVMRRVDVPGLPVNFVKG
jgi:sugar lactone lactonase YvrE